MNEKFIPVIQLALAALVIGVMVWFSTQNDELEIPELTENLCPVDDSLVGINYVVFYDFSDPLPKQYSNYPQQVLDSLLNNQVNQFDKVTLYTFNPYGVVPKEIISFCVPITLKSIPENERKAMWGKDPDLNAELPERYKKHIGVIKKLWDYDQSLKQSVSESIDYLKSKGSGSQDYSRLIENIEEMASIQKENQLINSTTRVLILSDMLQHTTRYSHYKKKWEFDSYLTTRKNELISMDGHSFQIHYLQTCKTQTSQQRREHKMFWNDYFSATGASAKFNLLANKDLNCSGSNKNKIRSKKKVLTKNNGLIASNSSTNKNTIVQPTRTIQDFLKNPNNIVGVEKMSEHQLNNLTENIINSIGKNQQTFGVSNIDNVQAGQKINRNELLQTINDGKIGGTENLIERASKEISTSNLTKTPVNNPTKDRDIPDYTVNEETNFNTPYHPEFAYAKTYNLTREAAMSTGGDTIKMDMSFFYKRDFGQAVKIAGESDERPDRLVFFDNNSSYSPRFNISNVGNKIKVYEFGDDNNPKDEALYAFEKSGDALHKAIQKVREGMIRER